MLKREFWAPNWRESDRATLNVGPWDPPFAPQEGQKALKSGRSQNEGIPEFGDSDSTALRKFRVVAAYLDILIHRRIWNVHAIDYSTIQYAMFLVMREIRGKTPAALAKILRKRLDDDPENFESNDSFRLHGMNGRQIHRLLARMTDYVETCSGQASRYSEYA